MQEETQDLRLRVVKKRKLGSDEESVWDSKCCQEMQATNSGFRKLEEGTDYAKDAASKQEICKREWLSLGMTSWVESLCECVKNGWPLMTLVAVPGKIRSRRLRLKKANKHG